jgi:hypothetical protein
MYNQNLNQNLNQNSNSNSNGLDDYFKTTDYKNMRITSEQGISANKNIQLVKGSDFHKCIYDIKDKNLVEEITVRYYQIAMFDEYNKCAIRSILLKGSSSQGACFFNYKMVELNDYKLSKRKIDKFVKILEKEKKKTNPKFKLMYKFYPVYNFNFTNPPTGNEINQCQSELLNNN